MKTTGRKIIMAAFALAVTLVFSMNSTAQAMILPDEDPNMEDPGMYVIYNENEKWESNFDGSAAKMEQIINEMQPGDEAIFRVTCTNQFKEVTKWYMENSVLKSLEDRNKNKNEGATGGAYTYELYYTGPGISDGETTSYGGTKTLFSSDTVGGLDTEAGVGLNQATINLGDWMYMGDLAKGETGMVTLHVILEGETQGNNYQDTLADLELRFSVETTGQYTITPTPTGTPTPPISSPPGKRINTGDSNNISGYLIAAAAAAIVLIIFAVFNIRKRKKNVAGIQDDYRGDGQ